MITQLKRIDINLCEGVAYGERVHIRGDGEERVAAEMERQYSLLSEVECLSRKEGGSVYHLTSSERHSPRGIPARLTSIPCPATMCTPGSIRSLSDLKISSYLFHLDPLPAFDIHLLPFVRLLLSLSG